MYKTKEKRKSFCFLLKQIVRKWETFGTNYICFLTPPPPPPLLLFLYVKGKWRLQKQTGIPSDAGLYRVMAVPPPQEVSSLGSGGLNMQLCKARSSYSVQGQGWWGTYPHRLAPDTGLWRPVVHDLLSSLPMGKQCWLAGTKREPLLYCFSFPLPSLAEASMHLIEEVQTILYFPA